MDVDLEQERAEGTQANLFPRRRFSSLWNLSRSEERHEGR
jgi:hypothetical protein